MSMHHIWCDLQQKVSGTVKWTPALTWEGHQIDGQVMSKTEAGEKGREFMEEERASPGKSFPSRLA